jgi:hypothetical protein
MSGGLRLLPGTALQGLDDLSERVEGLAGSFEGLAAPASPSGVQCYVLLAYMQHGTRHINIMAFCAVNLGALMLLPDGAVLLPCHPCDTGRVDSFIV